MKLSTLLSAAVALSMACCLGSGPAAASTTLSTPSTVDGRPIVTDPSLTGSLPGIKAQLAAAIPGTTSVVYAYYGHQGASDLIMVSAQAAPLSDPKATLGRFLANLTGPGGFAPISGVDVVDPGALGGYAQCGASAADGHPVVVCGWADRGSVGTVTWFQTGQALAESRFVTVRGQIEHAR